MEFSKPLMLNTQMLEQQFGKPFYDDFQTFYDECFGEAQEYVRDQAIQRVCDWWNIWKGLDVYQDVVDLANDVLKDMKEYAKAEYERISDEVDNPDFDSNEHPYIEIDIPIDDDIFDAYLDYAVNNNIEVEKDDEVIERTIDMVGELDGSSEISDLEDEYVMNYLYDVQSSNPDTIDDIAENHDLTKLQKLYDDALEEYRS